MKRPTDCLLLALAIALVAQWPTRVCGKNFARICWQRSPVREVENNASLVPVPVDLEFWTNATRGRAGNCILQ